MSSRNVGTPLSAEIPAPLIAHYAETGSEPVAVDRAALEAMGVEVHAADLLAADGDLIRHDSGKLAAAVLALKETRVEAFDPDGL